MLQSQEFTYKNILAKARVRQRDIINRTIDQLINHGYLVRKRPIIFFDNKSSYLSIFSYIDPGIVTYLNGANKLTEIAMGHQIEGYIHSRLSNLGNINTELITNFVKEQRCGYGIVIYGGVPYKDSKKKLLFGPYWLF
ncbi:MAG: hypothetical protein A2504_07805 [Bdellovibrionales bacterium RIFOXYD12_FULL_39_22]|nr:MAG: hypothetical protein A2385_11130 [Bdellovibrionales bacterium RIFOXYB1_FULL_39_21]OFZ41266.1 MAG: hypothetical protein A2485_00555 [Bdellovibrionales bacterium RIFOXYC12_FULL_39_17]OFZ45084.1 MAG: hypothetical protein A2404_11425 [Bdellovibrionales bacterium RIFOXYC1_FULL_39_130]OFZ68093.1 MAG: hypothetical protein A2451_15755 [Bdellovibrionales bacterium RIFOXYC2_FULL_39_8]OFZ74468.1 MAG: hypothetical protein A2560_11460 [Bdellovibrionales bacterium RIFOXYD1_FULL_39_84]OFZ92480.1 MAG: